MLAKEILEKNKFKLLYLKKSTKLTIIYLLSGWGQSFYIISTYHSMFNTLMMIYFIKPYRQAIVSRPQNTISPGGSSIAVLSKQRNNISYVSKF